MPKYYDFKVTLKDAEPKIWRRFLLHPDATFGDLHVAIQHSFGWRSCHLWQFSKKRWDEVIVDGSGSNPFDLELPSDASGPELPLASYFEEHQRCLYMYDFGDSWEHEVLCHKRRPALDEVFLRRLENGERTGPPEDCGGVWGFEELLALAKRPRKTLDPEERDRLAWYFDEDWSPELDVQALREAFDRDLSKPSDKRSFPVDLSTLDPQLAKVSKTLETVMSAQQESREAIHCAHRMWEDFVHMAAPTVRKPVIYAAAIHYAFKFVDGDPLSQSEIATLYKTSATSVSQAFRRIDEALDLDACGDDYATLGPSDRFDASPKGAPSTLMSVDQALAVLKEQPQRDGSWSLLHMGDMVPPPVLGEEPLELHMIHDDVNRKILGPVIVSWIHVLEYALIALGQHAQALGWRPRVLRVSMPGLALDLRQDLSKAGLHTVEDPCEDLAELFEELDAEIGAPRAEPASYFVHPEVQGSDVRTFFEVTARLWRQAPWSHMPEHAVGRIDLEDHAGKQTFWVVAIGHNREVFGLGIYRSLEELELLLSGHSQGLWSDASALSFLERGDESSKRLEAELKALGIDLGDQAMVPWVIHGSPDRKGLDANTIRTFSALSEAMIEATKALKGQTPDPSKPVVCSVETPKIEGIERVEITLPVPLGDEVMAYLSNDRFYPHWEAEEHLTKKEFLASFQYYVKELLRRFAPSQEFNRLLDHGHQPHRIDAFVYASMTLYGLDPFRLGPGQLQQVLFGPFLEIGNMPGFGAQAQMDEILALFEFASRHLGVQIQSRALAFLQDPSTSAALAKAMPAFGSHGHDAPSTTSRKKGKSKDRAQSKAKRKRAKASRKKSRKK